MTLKHRFNILEDEIDGLDEILEKDLSEELNASPMAIVDAKNAVEFDGVYFHQNEITFAHNRANPSEEIVYCNSCDWERALSSLPEDSGIMIPPFCPDCYRKSFRGRLRTKHTND